MFFSQWGPVNMIPWDKNVKFCLFASGYEAQFIEIFYNHRFRIPNVEQEQELINFFKVFFFVCVKQSLTLIKEDESNLFLTCLLAFYKGYNAANYFLSSYFFWKCKCNQLSGDVKFFEINAYQALFYPGSYPRKHGWVFSEIQAQYLSWMWANSDSVKQHSLKLTSPFARSLRIKQLRKNSCFCLQETQNPLVKLRQKLMMVQESVS